MKKFLILITLVLFSAGALTEAFAAPARNARAGSGAKATQKRVVAPQATRQARAKAANKKRTRQAKVKSTLKLEESAVTALKEGQRGKEEQMGLMPSELDYLNHNVFHADAAAIRGARDTESALRYIPFVTITNTAGFGQSFDMRGQGRLAANGVKLYINGVPANPTDSYYVPMPINTIIPSLIQEIEVFPGSGSVQYGAGTKGGTINVITSKRQNPYFLVGAGYVKTTASKGNSFNAFAQAAENLGFANVNAGLAASVLGGPREDDSFLGGHGVLGATVPLGLGQQIDADIDFFYGKSKTTPYNSLFDKEAVFEAILNTPWDGGNYGEPGRAEAVFKADPREPSADARAEKGDGEIETTTLRGSAVVGYTSDLATRLQFNADAFMAYESIKFDKYAVAVPVFVLGATDTQGKYTPTWFMSRPLPKGDAYANINPMIEGIDGQQPYLEQNGSVFTEMKFGGKTEINWKHQNGFFVFGLSGQYEMSKRNPKQYLRTAIPWITTAGNGGIGSTSMFRAIEAHIDNKLDMNVITAGVYVVEKYDFNPQFSLMVGGRYEMKNYNVKVEDFYKGNRIVFKNTAGQWKWNDGNLYINSGELQKDQFSDETDPANNPTAEYKENHDNFIGEIAPVFKYSQTGAIYARGELGYITPPAWAYLQRYGFMDTKGNPHTDGFEAGPGATNPITFHFMYRTPELKNETYYTAELGWKEIIGRRIIPAGFIDIDISALLFSANVFYTASQNEFYFEGDTYSGLTVGNYDKSRRLGGEVALEQILFNGMIRFNESFMYLKAEKNQGDGWTTMPYTYDYKGTFGASVDVSGFLEIVNVSLAVWLQNSIYGNQQVVSKTTKAYGAGANTTGYDIVDDDPLKLKPYLISDFGLTIGINKGMGTFTAGVKNVFDTVYYDYYNNDRSAAVNENRFVFGRGRTVFVEGTFKY